MMSEFDKIFERDQNLRQMKFNGIFKWDSIGSDFDKMWSKLTRLHTSRSQTRIIDASCTIWQQLGVLGILTEKNGTVGVTTW